MTQTRLSDIHHIQQDNPSGCTLACIAMIIGKSYDDVKRIADQTPDPRMNRYGHVRMFWEEWLYRRGFAIQNYAKYDPTTNQKRLIWPIPLWAELHLCSVDGCWGEGSHLVIVKHDGTVFDPARKELSHWGSYTGVVYMSGIFDIGTRISLVG